jgi:hypothetical protein
MSVFLIFKSFHKGFRYLANSISWPKLVYLSLADLPIFVFPVSTYTVSFVSMCELIFNHRVLSVSNKQNYNLDDEILMDHEKCLDS